jgi:hypothetical protein
MERVVPDTGPGCETVMGKSVPTFGPNRAQQNRERKMLDTVLP